MPLEKFRSIDDFLVGGARYEMPNFRDMEKWNNRILQNLIYYQTNYFAAGALIAALLAVASPQQTAWLTFAVALAAGAVYALRVQPSLSAAYVPAHLRTYVLSVAVTAAVLVVWAAGAVTFGLLLVLVPAFAALVHASLRKRNVSNKLVNLLTDARHTPMGWAIGRLERCAGGAMEGRFAVGGGEK